MIDNTWYYTLSTIAQTLAAISGLAAVFSTLRLESLNRNIGEYKNRAIKVLLIRRKHEAKYQIPNKTQVVEKHLKEYIASILGHQMNSELQRDLIDSIIQYNLHAKDLGYFLQDIAYSLDSFLDQRDGVFKLIKIPGLLAAFTIGLSIVFLGLSEQLLYTEQVSQVGLLHVVVTLSLMSGYSIMRATWKLLGGIRSLE